MSTPATVETAIQALIAAGVYPDGVPDSKVSPTVGFPVKINRGWPQKEELNADLTNDPPCIHICINRHPGMVKMTTRYSDAWVAGPSTLAGITSVIAGQTVSYSGAYTGPQNIGLKIGSVGYAMALSDSVTPEEVAASMAALVNQSGVHQASVSGAVLTVATPATPNYVASSGACTLTREVGRATAGFMVSIFAPSILARDAAEAVMLPAVIGPDALDLPDGGFPAVMESSIQNDAAENADLYRSDTVFSTEYAITQTKPGPGSILFTCTRFFVPADATDPTLLAGTVPYFYAEAYRDIPVSTT